MTYDLLLKGGRIVDPAQELDCIAHLGISGGRIAGISPDIGAGQARRTLDVTGLLVLPGLIDLHVHCYQHVLSSGLQPDSVGVHAGVTSVVDQGSVGVYTFQGFRKFIVEPASTAVYCFLSATCMGAPTQIFRTPALLGPELIDVEATVQLIQAHRDIIRGVKVFGETGSFSRWGGEVVALGKRIAAMAGVPLYVHTGSLLPVREPFALSPEDVLPKLLPMLGPGDILAHPFSFAPGGMTTPDGRVLPAVLDAMEQGVRVDVGHGLHFSFEVARKVLDQGLIPFTIGSDQHGDLDIPGMSTRSDTSLTLAMSKLLTLGLALPQVLAMATANPATALGLTDRAGSLKPGMPADISVIVLQEGQWTYRDCVGGTLEGRQRLVPVMAIRGGRVYPVNSAFLPSLEALQEGE